MEYPLDSITKLTEQLFTQTMNNTSSVNNDLAQETQDILRDRMDILSISEFGKEINSLYESVKETGSEDAMSSFRNFMADLARNPDNMDTVNFVDTTEQLTEAGEETTQETFETLGRVEDAEADSRTWVNNLNEMDSSRREQYVDVTNSILDSEDEEASSKVLDQLTSTISTIQDSGDLADEEKDVLLNDLLSGVEERSTLTDIEDYIQNFTEENL